MARRELPWQLVTSVVETQGHQDSRTLLYLVSSDAVRYNNCCRELIHGDREAGLWGTPMGTLHLSEKLLKVAHFSLNCSPPHPLEPL